LALTTTLLDASETDERRYARKMNLENRENRGSSYQYMGWMSERISLGGVFFLDIPSYRTMLLVSLLGIHFKRILNFGKGRATLEMFEIFARDYLACDARTPKNQKEKVPAQFPRFEFEVS